MSVNVCAELNPLIQYVNVFACADVFEQTTDIFGNLC